jgi:hypothetical protein
MDSSSSCADLIRASISEEKRMDCRVKPGNDKPACFRFKVKTLQMLPHCGRFCVI